MPGPLRLSRTCWSRAAYGLVARPPTRPETRREPVLRRPGGDLLTAAGQPQGGRGEGQPLGGATVVAHSPGRADGRAGPVRHRQARRPDGRAPPQRRRRQGDRRRACRRGATVGPAHTAVPGRAGGRADHQSAGPGVLRGQPLLGPTWDAGDAGHRPAAARRELPAHRHHGPGGRRPPRARPAGPGGRSETRGM